MAKQGKTEASGLLVVDKPLGVTSHDVVAAVRGALHMRRVGHAGTLDPQASGVLVVGFGHGTRLLNYIVDHTKTYEATIRLGQTSTTDDSEGEISTVASVRLEDGSDSRAASTGPAASAGQGMGHGYDEHYEHDEHGGQNGPRVSRELTVNQIEQAIAEHLTGDIEQVPSVYSAVRVNGHHAYELARQGKEVKLEARKVTISEFSVLEARNVEVELGGSDKDGDGNEIQSVDAVRSVTSVVDVDVRISCSTGTYIRSLGRDLGRLLGVGGYLTRLRRTRVGRFDVNESKVVTAHAMPHTFTNRQGEEVTLNKAVLDVNRDELLQRALPMLEAAKRTMTTIEISENDAADLRFGRRIEGSLPDTAPTAAAYVPQTGEVVGIAEPANDHELKSVLVFPAES
ncbi:tRNA pseudouridine(55) synthase TruB [Bifidobacterium sp. ESL0790]|uniref:tRNA pseudouridine synthase B n=1 Tax=Bifidobacterium sp. ESL0790 TaxID=2983233 RepID=UPI0023F8BD70|nr:tRNA pseudouridine(55) synthase TruB [Bifidobacterium sp. ESL0790]WEV72073.1 tRNA pseudouridine(55) synthase TruB [Bifidobacterium sp. ESL0790]